MLTEEEIQRSRKRIWKGFAMSLHNARVKQNWTVEQAAKALGANPQSYGKYENIHQIRDINIERMIRMLAVYGLKIKTKIDRV